MQTGPVLLGVLGDAPPGRGEVVLWVCGAIVFALILVAGYFAYLNPAMLIEFASMRLCG